MNHLSTETSPYLLQHANNPVDWYPWCRQAFEAARSSEKPILLSIGYSTCHWCHVMAHESFEDKDVAALINKNFIAIKVDREERPDLDSIYMDALLAINGSGGWPLTAFLFPDGKPFFAGTYFPPLPTRRLPSFTSVLKMILKAWNENRDDLLSQADLIIEAISEVGNKHSKPATPILEDILSSDRQFDRLSRTYQQIEPKLITWLVEHWDSAWGGFGQAPKFPQTGLIEFAIRQLRDKPDNDVMRAIISSTLGGMAGGGIYDHLGGGFARYSTDNRWMVPHFEKMLYDQALISKQYLYYYQLSQEPQWLQVVNESIDYVLSDLKLDSGGYGCGRDADSQGQEGIYYLWTALEVTENLPEDLADAFMDWYGVTWKGNFENGTNILMRHPGANLIRPIEVEEARKRLLALRNGRIAPQLDDKVLAEWNAMFLSTLCQAASATANSKWKQASLDLGEFLTNSLRRESDGRWMRVFHPSKGPYNLANCADLGWIIDSFTRLYEMSGRSNWIDLAKSCAEQLLANYRDPNEGGFYATAHDAEALILRRKDISDGSTPSGNSIACLALYRLGRLTGNERLVQTALECIELVQGHLEQSPLAFPFTSLNLEMIVAPASEVVISGSNTSLIDQVQRRYLPHTVLAHGQVFDSPLWDLGQSSSLSDSSLSDQAFVCSNYSCNLPTNDPMILGELLDALN